MPRRAASLRIERPWRPSSSSSSRAAATISRARGRSASGALEAIAGAQAVADRAVEGDVRRPGERADEVAAREHAERGERAERGRAPEAVGEVVRGDRARV